jgi:sulfofructose kinase
MRALALAPAEAQDGAENLRLAAAAAALKCTHFGGIAGTPGRAEVEQLVAAQS